MMNTKKIYYLVLLILLIPGFCPAQWIPTSFDESYLNSASFLSKDSFLINSNGKLFHTVNGGQSFESIPNYPIQAAYNIVYKSKDTLLVARETTKGLLCSYDAGQTWITQTLLMSGGDTAFKDGRIGFLGFFDSLHGIIFGDTLNGLQQVFLTEDGGLTWMFQQNLYSPQYIRFPSYTRGGASINNYLFPSGIGKIRVADSKLLTFKNYGKEWYIDTTLSVDQSYWSIAFKDELNGIALIGIPTRGNVLFKTNDGGGNWTEIYDSSNKSNGNLLYVKATAQYEGFYLASTLNAKGESNASYDDGQTWQLFDTFNHGSGNVFFKDAETGICTNIFQFSFSPIYYYKPLNTGLCTIAGEGHTQDICYPNPASNLIYFSRPFVTVQIWDGQGKLVGQYNNSQSIDLSDISNGFYWVRIVDKDQYVSAQKLLIQH